MENSSELTSAKEVLLASEAQFRYLYAPVMVHTVDRDGKLVAVSNYWLKALGYTRGDVLGRPLVDFMTEVSRQSVEEMGSPRFYRDSFAINFYAQLVKNTGEVIDTLLSAIAVRDQAGNFLRSIAVVTDITERKRAEQALARSEEHFRNLIEGSIQGILIHRNWKPVYVNQAYTDILGYESPEEILAMETREPQIAPYDRARLRAYKDARLKGENVPSQYEYDAVRKDGSIVTLQNLVRLVSWEGEPATQNTVIDVTEHKRAEDALRESEKRLRLLLETTNAIPWEASLDPWQFKYVGPQAVNLLGYPSEKWYEKDFWPAHIHPEDRESAIDFCEKSAGRAKDYEFEYRMIAADGSIVWLHAIVNVAVNGRPRTLRGFMLDITERKQAEQALQASENRYRSVIETAASAIIHVSPDHKILEWNHAASRIYGWKRHEVLGKDYLKLFLPEEVREAVAADMQRVLAGEYTESFENPVRTRDGVERTLSWNVSRLVDTTDRAIGIVAIGMDITERKRAEEALFQSEENYRRLVDNSLGLMCSHDLRGNLLSINPAATEALGYRREDCVGRNIRSALPPSVRHLFDDYLERIRQNRSDSGLVRLVTKGGDERIWFYRNVLYEQPGSTPRVLGHALDITERKRAEEALRKSEKSLRASEERYRTLIESSPYCIHEIDLQGGVSSMNPAGLRMMGVTDERDVKGMPYLDVVSDDDRSRVGELMDLAYKGKSSEFEFVAVNGVYSQSSFVPITDEDGVVIKLMGLTQDITDRKRAQGELETALAEVARLKDRLQAENIYLREEIDLDHNFGEIIGQSEGLRKLLLKVEQVAATNATVLILGETGTGKELLARAIHRLSQRKDRPLVKVSCATLPSSLIERELFGHEKGAFTGAVSSQAGRFDLANGATIFLDEIGDLPLDLQAKLLRVLQEGEFERLGNPRTVKADVRVIAATNRDLEGAVHDGRFRADLYHRLNVFPLVVPPLRERRDDIPMLVQSFVNRYKQKLGKKIDAIPQRTMTVLQQYPWPGNIRELENVIERAVIITQGSTLRVEDTFDPRRATALEVADRQTLEEVERDYIERTLAQTKWRIEGRSGAAVVLGINPGTLRSRMRKLGIRRH